MNYYELLGLAENATNDEIKRAYRLAIKKYHPDLHTNATPEQKKEFEAKTKEINEAYYVLSDERRRSEYDLSLRTGRFGGGYSGGSRNSGRSGGFSQYGGPGGGYGHYGGYGQENWKDFGFSSQDFEDFFGKHGRSYGSYSKEEQENLKRQWEQFFRSNKQSGFYWGNSGPYNSDKGNTYGNYRPGDNPFRWGGRHSSGPFGGSSLLGQMFFMLLRRKMLGPFLFIVVLFLIIFGRYLFYFLVLYLIYKALKWSLKVIAR